MKLMKKLAIAGAIVLGAMSLNAAQAKVYKFATNIPEIGDTADIDQ